MSLIKLRRKPIISDEQIKKAQDDVDRWVSIRNMIGSNGWHHLKQDLENELKRQNTVKGVTAETLLARAGLVEGLEYPFIRIRDYERAAIEGEKILAFVEAGNKE